MDKDFETIAEEQGWNNDTVVALLMDFIDNHADKAELIRFAQAAAEEENDA